MGSREAYKHLLIQNMIFGRKLLKQIVAETRQNWVDNFKTLLKAIKVPTLLLWFSTRQPEYRELYLSVGTLFGRFPHLVNSQMLEEIKSCADIYIQCVSSRGLPQPLVNRFSSEPVKIDPRLVRKDLGKSNWTYNFYYPSPEMHVDAFRKLVLECRKIT
jgi:hypothetical protein